MWPFSRKGRSQQQLSMAELLDFAARVDRNAREEERVIMRHELRVARDAADAATLRYLDAEVRVLRGSA